MSSIIKYLSILLILSINIKDVSNVCTPGGNCPKKSGICIAGECICMPGYQTLNIPGSMEPSIYCNYEQKSRWIALIFELLFPSLGLFYIGRIVHGIIKLFLFISTLIVRNNRPSGSCLLCCCCIVYGFLILLIVDIICLIFGLYLDGNGVPLT